MLTMCNLVGSLNTTGKIGSYSIESWFYSKGHSKRLSSVMTAPERGANVFSRIILWWTLSSHSASLLSII